MAKKPPTTVTNRLLASLPASEYKALLRHMEPIHIAKKRILCEVGQAMRNAYFFHSGLASLFAVAEDARTVQIAIVGTDGFVGVPIALMSNKTAVRIVTQTPVDAVKIDAEQLIARCSLKMWDSKQWEGVQYVLYVPTWELDCGYWCFSFLHLSSKCDAWQFTQSDNWHRST